MVRNLSMTELHRSPGAALRRIVTREDAEIVVTERGRPIARILPVASDSGPALAIAAELEGASHA